MAIQGSVGRLSLSCYDKNVWNRSRGCPVSQCQ